MGFFDTCKTEEDPLKNEGKKISHCTSMHIFYDALGQLNQQSEIGSP